MSNLEVKKVVFIFEWLFLVRVREEFGYSDRKNCHLLLPDARRMINILLPWEIQANGKSGTGSSKIIASNQYKI